MSHEMSSSNGRGPLLRPAGRVRPAGTRGKRPWSAPTAEGRRGTRVAGYAIAIVVNMILIAIARAIPSWGLSFVTPTFEDVLPAIERSLVAAILANAALCAHDAAWFRHLAQVVMNAFALNATITVARVFPFDFGSPEGNDFARLLAALACIAVVIAIFAEVVQLLLALPGRRPGCAE